MQEFERLIGPTDTTKIIDVGGDDDFNWSFIGARPRVTLLNVAHKTLEVSEPRFFKRVGDARSIPYPTYLFDVAYSNSVIEHVGSWADQQCMAREVARVAPRYYVQTPNRDFFLETHTWTPLVHKLPVDLTRVARNWTVWGWLVRPPQSYVDELLGQLRLLNEAELRQLFPDARIIREQFMGLTKSLIAVRA
jgi:hypothetical protein